MSAMASAQQNHSPMLVLGGRAPAMRWGQGSLQEIDHVPFVRPLVEARARPRDARPRSRASSTTRSPPRRAPHTGPAFVDFPLDHVFMEAPSEPRAPARGRRAAARPARRRRRARARGGAAARRRAAGDHGRHRPLLGARRGTRCARSPRQLRHPGVPQRPRARLRAGRPRAVLLARARRGAQGRRRRARDRRADGLPARLRRRVRRGDRDRRDRRRRAGPRPSARGRGRAVRRRRRRRCDALRDGAAAAPARARRGSRSCATVETEKRAARARASSTTTARRCTRCASTASSPQVLDRDAIVIGDGGDFVSYAGRVIDSYEPGCWLDPGPFGCLGSGPGYALAAKLAHPDRQVVLLLGDGAFGFSGMEFDTLARHGVARRRRDGQQRHLGAREAPDGVPLRLLGRRRAAAGDALRPGRRGARRPRRARRARRASCGRRSSARSRRARRRSSTC